MHYCTEYWKEKAQACQPALLEDLIPLLQIESVREDSLATAEEPFGPGPAKALQYMLDIAKRDGFDCENLDNYAGVIRFGCGEKILGILAHLDVVPATGEWTTPAFEPTFREGQLFARGASDDKGPAMACYYALRLLKDAGILPNMQIHFILGTDEESGWGCMDYYFSHHPMPDMAFSPDADFPIINGEKGMFSLPIFFSHTQNTGDYTLLSFTAGMRANIVAEHAGATLSGKHLSLVAADWHAYLKQHSEIIGTSTETDDTLTLSCQGKSAHAMEPEKGVNAGTYLADFLSNYLFTNANAYFSFIARYLHKQTDGIALDIASHDDIMGDVTVNPGIFSFSEDKGEVLLNIRYPRSTTLEKILAKLQPLVTAHQGTWGAPQHPQSAHYVPAEHPLVKTLLKVYHAHTGHIAHERSIGGGTYGRLVECGVAYGMTMPDSNVVIHQPNESLVLKDLEQATAIYADAIYQLTK